MVGAGINSGARRSMHTNSMHINFRWYDIEKQSILDFLNDKVAKWWLPDEIIFLKELPHGATGKLQKFELRKEFKNHYMEK